MFADKLIIQSLEGNNELRTTIIRDQHGEPLLVDFPRFCLPQRRDEQAFAIFSDRQKLEVTHYIKEQLDMAPDYIISSDGSIEFRQVWENIPIDPYGGMGLYALIFPEFASLHKLHVRTNFDRYGKDSRLLIKDPDFRRYMFYLRLQPQHPTRHCSFTISASFHINKDLFLKSTLSHSDVEVVCDTSSSLYEDIYEIRNFQAFFQALKEHTKNPSLEILLNMGEVEQPKGIVGAIHIGKEVALTEFERTIEKMNMVRAPNGILETTIKIMRTIDSLAEYDNPNTIWDPEHPNKTSKYKKADCAMRLCKILAEASKGLADCDTGFIRYSLSKIKEDMKDFPEVIAQVNSIEEFLDGLIGAVSE